MKHSKKAGKAKRSKGSSNDAKNGTETGTETGAETGAETYAETDAETVCLKKSAVADLQENSPMDITCGPCELIV